MIFSGSVVKRGPQGWTASVALAVLVVACGGRTTLPLEEEFAITDGGDAATAPSYDCAARGPCPVGPSPNQGDIDQCNRAVRSPCGWAFVKVQICYFQTAERCNSWGGDDLVADQAICCKAVLEYARCLAPDAAGLGDCM
jgi:hypothetical protein